MALERIPQEVVEGFRSSAQALLGLFPEVWRAGREFRARCPLHDDGSPSLTIYRHKDGAWMWHCFPCSKSGDVFSMLRARGMSFPAAVRFLEAESREVNFSRDPWEGKPPGRQRLGEPPPTHVLHCERRACVSSRLVTLLDVAFALDTGEATEPAPGDFRWVCQRCRTELQRDRRWWALWRLYNAPRRAPAQARRAA